MTGPRTFNYQMGSALSHLKIDRHQTERNEVYSISLPGRIYRVIGDLYSPAAMYARGSKGVDPFEEALSALHFLERTAL